MTVYMTLKEIDSGRLKWDDQIKLSKYAKALANNPDISNPPLYKDSYSVRELVDSAMIVSANSSAIALAEKIAGNEPKFMDMVKEQLKDWGIKDYQLLNSSGLNNSMLNGHIYPGSSRHAENELSARSLAIVARHLIQDYPEILSISSQTQLLWGNDVLTNSNHLLPGNSMGRYGVDGLKTGTTAKAGQTYIGTAVQDNMRVIVVILHANDAENDNEARFVESNKLFDYCFQNYKKVTYAKNSPLPKKLAISNAKQKTIPYVSKTEFSVVQSPSLKSVDYHFKLTEKEVKAPVKKGEKLGKIFFQDKADYLDEKPETAIYAAKRVESLTLWEKFINLFTHQY
ncbi:serine hydrolase [Streptococcus penaeicida]|nr:serine hydrolase [Streptococcus penaeicida]